MISAREDGGALVLDTEPLSEPLEIMGAPIIELELEVDQPQAMVCVRLSDLAPDHKATRSTYGMLNLSHRDSHASPSPLVPGERYRVAVQLNGIAQRFPGRPPPEDIDLHLLLAARLGRAGTRLPDRASRRQPSAAASAAGAARRQAIAGLWGTGISAGDCHPFIEAPEQNWRVIRDLSRMSPCWK